MQNPTITYTAKCDIYSLGVILWELSSCVIPFEAQLQDVMLAVNIIAGVREKTVPGTAVEYEMLYRRCWDGLPQSRPQMEIVLSELVELLASEQINPRPAAPRPRSPRPTRPLSSDSMVAPSVSFPYEHDTVGQSSPENTNHVRPASPPSLQRPGARQSFAGLGPLALQTIPSVPIRTDRSGARVSYLGEPIVKEAHANGHSKGSGTPQADTGRNGHAKQTQVPYKSNGHVSANANATNNHVNNSRVAGVNGSPTGLDMTMNDIIPSGAAKPTMKEADAENENGSGVTPTQTPRNGAPDYNGGQEQAPENVASSTSILQLLPPLSFTALSFSTSGSSSKDSFPLPTQGPTPEATPATSPTHDFAFESSPESALEPEGASKDANDPSQTPAPIPDPVQEPFSKLPETAAIAFSTGLSMVEVVSKLKLGSIRNIPTISPPPPGAPPPPPGAVAGHSNSPRVISPPSASRPRVISPPNTRPPRSSKTIQPPPGLPPNSAAKPPQGPPPAPVLTGVSGANSASQRNPGVPIKYIPTTTYSPSSPRVKPTQERPKAIGRADGSEPGFVLAVSTLADTTRPMPARQIPMGFPVVTPLSPPHWNKRQTPLAPEDTSPSFTPSISSSTAPTQHEPPSSEISATALSAGYSPTLNRRDFRPISFLTQQQKSEHTARTDQSRAARPADNAYVPNPSNNIVPPSQLNMQRAQSPELRREARNSRILGSPSLRPAGLPVVEKRVGISPSPHLGPLNPRPASPAFPTAMANGGFPVVESFTRREQNSKYHE